jgi:hypothetical protein
VKRRSAFLAAALLTLLGVLAASSAAFGRSTADDLSLQIQLARGGGFLQGTTTTSPFQLGFGVEVDSGPLQTFTLRVTLPDGLHWGPDGPDPTEGCAGTAPAVCVQKLEENAAGTVGGGWSWDVVADRPGPYEVTAMIQGERPDPNTSNNTDTFRFEVVASSGGGGGSVSVSASAVKLTPAKPKAGSAVVASASVTADGSPVKPSKVICAGTLAGKKAIGTGTAVTGRASCRYPTPKTAKGKTLAGSLKITARGKTITKRFSTKLG